MVDRQLVWRPIKRFDGHYKSIDRPRKQKNQNCSLKKS